MMPSNEADVLIHLSACSIELASNALAAGKGVVWIGLSEDGAHLLEQAVTGH